MEESEGDEEEEDDEVMEIDPKDEEKFGSTFIEGGEESLLDSHKAGEHRITKNGTVTAIKVVDENHSNIDQVRRYATTED